MADPIQALTQQYQQAVTPTQGALPGYLTQQYFDLSPQALGIAPRQNVSLDAAGLKQAGWSEAEIAKYAGNKGINYSQIAKLLNIGVGKDFITGQLDQRKGGAARGVNIDPKDFGKFASQATPDDYQKRLIQAQMSAMMGTQFQFDPNQYLPGIQQQATNIYAPQQAQLEAIRQLQGLDYQASREQTQEDFDKEFQSAVESINSRGAFFSGGAITQEGEIETRRSRALTQLGLSALAADFSNLTQQALLQNEKNQFITDSLFNSEASAFNRFRDQRDFSMNAIQNQWAMYVDERNFARSVFESDRSFNEQVRQFEKNYSLSKEEMKLARTKFNEDVRRYNNDYSQALSSFKTNYAVTNSGVLGVTADGTDKLDSYRQQWETSNTRTSNSSPNYLQGQSMTLQDWINSSLSQ